MWMTSLWLVRGLALIAQDKIARTRSNASIAAYDTVLDQPVKCNKSSVKGDIVEGWLCKGSADSQTSIDGKEPSFRFNNVSLHRAPGSYFRVIEAIVNFHAMQTTKGYHHLFL